MCPKSTKRVKKITSRKKKPKSVQTPDKADDEEPEEKFTNTVLGNRYRVINNGRRGL